MKMLKVQTDPQADAVYIYLSEFPVAYTKEIDADRHIDYGNDGSPVGISLLGVSEGVETEDLPERIRIEKLLEGLGIKTYA